MNRQQLHLALTSALFSALAACGGVVDPPAGTGDAGEADGSDEVATDAPPSDAGACRPIPNNSPCSERVVYPCGLPFEPSSMGFTNEQCATLCAPIAFASGASPFGCYAVAADSGPERTVWCTSCAVGRRPADLVEGVPAACDDPVGVALAEMAHVEAASVHAFRRLEGVLAGLAADEALLGRVRRAARDEVRHARLVARLARVRGARPRRVEVDSTHVASTYELALENAVEGCVHETLGVAYLAHQREHAADPTLRAMADALYEDELDHAALSWDLVGFFDARLDDGERASLRVAQAAALSGVIDEIGRIDPTVRDALGLPPPAVVAGLVSTLRQTVYARGEA